MRHFDGEITADEVRTAMRLNGGWAAYPPDVLFTYMPDRTLACQPWRCRVYRRVPGTQIEVYGEALADLYRGSNDIIGAFGRAAFQFAGEWEYWALLLNWSA